MKGPFLLVVLACAFHVTLAIHHRLQGTLTKGEICSTDDDCANLKEYCCVAVITDDQYAAKVAKGMKPATIQGFVKTGKTALGGKCATAEEQWKFCQTSTDPLLASDARKAGRKPATVVTPPEPEVPEVEVVDPVPITQTAVSATDPLPAALKSGAIMLVWIGNGELPWHNRFNIFLWKAAGFKVQVYTHRRDYPTLHTAASLGLADGDVEVIELVLHLKSISHTDGTPLEFMRNVLVGWLAANDRAKWLDADKDWKTRTFNTIDLTKSYLAASKIGIVLDAKVGPSEHLGKYISPLGAIGQPSAFEKYFVSYTRAGKTVNAENQLMGTFDSAPEKRATYATRFGGRMSSTSETTVAYYVAKAVDTWFGLITNWHGTAWAAKELPHIDTATEVPKLADGTTDAFTKDSVKVGEIGADSFGPFCVYKKANEQTNQSNSGGATKEKDIWNLCKSSLALIKGEAVRATFGATCGDKTCLAKAEALIPTTEPAN